jgi:hypothetical protein
VLLQVLVQGDAFESHPVRVLEETLQVDDLDLLAAVEVGTFEGEETGVAD